MPLKTKHKVIQPKILKSIPSPYTESVEFSVMTKKSVCLGFMAFDVAFDLPACLPSRLLLLEQLTMAHNQDRLQNSDSSVVYGHGHIIYSHTVAAL